MKLDVYYDGYDMQVREPDGDGWDRGDTHFIPTELRAVPNDGAFDLAVKPGDEIYVIVAVYDTGDTFGRKAMRHEVMGAFAALDEAKPVYRKYMEFADPNPSPTKPIVSWGFEHDGKHYYVPWLGYFERYVDCYIACTTVQLDRH